MTKKNHTFKKILLAVILVVATSMTWASAVLPVYAQAGDAADKAVGEEKSDSPDTGSESPFVVPLRSEGYEPFQKIDVATTPQGMLEQFVYVGLFRNLKYILGAIAVLFIMVSSVKLIIAGDNEDVVTKQKAAITYALFGLIVIAFADEMSRVLTVGCAPGDPTCSEGGFLSGPQALIQQASIFKREVRVFITFIKYLIGGIAVFMLVRNAIRFIALYGNEESVSLDKKNLAFTSLGLILIVIASTAIDKVLYVVDTDMYPFGGVQPAVSPEAGIREIIGFTNMAVTFVAPIAILVLIIGAIMYATSGSNEENMNRAKRLIILAVIGMILIYGAFAIVSTVVSGQFTP